MGKRSSVSNASMVLIFPYKDFKASLKCHCFSSLWKGLMWLLEETETQRQAGLRRTVLQTVPLAPGSGSFQKPSQNHWQHKVQVPLLDTYGLRLPIFFFYLVFSFSSWTRLFPVLCFCPRSSPWLDHHLHPCLSRAELSIEVWPLPREAVGVWNIASLHGDRFQRLHNNNKKNVKYFLNNLLYYYMLKW